MRTLVATSLLFATLTLSASSRICLEPTRRDAMVYYAEWPADKPCIDMPPDAPWGVPYTYPCEVVRGLPHCNPPSTFQLQNPAAPQGLSGPMRYGGEVKIAGVIYWKWMDQAGNVKYLTGRFFARPPATN